MKPLTVAFLLALSGFAASLPARAEGRAPTAQERVAIVHALEQHGFSTWGEVEFEHGKWEVEHARHGDGFIYEVHLAPGDFALLGKKRED